MSDYDTPADCPFCEKFRTRDYDTYDSKNNVINFEPLNPVTEGHRLFVPAQHVVDAAQNPYITAQTFGAAAGWASRNLSPLQAFNLITSAGEYATQTVEHLHVHLVPRNKDDGLALPWTGQKSNWDKGDYWQDSAGRLASRIDTFLSNPQTYFAETLRLINKHEEKRLRRERYFESTEEGVGWS